MNNKDDLSKKVIPTNEVASKETSSGNNEPVQDPIPIVDEKLVEKAQKAHEELETLRERQNRYTDAEMQARQTREDAGKDVALAGAKVLEAVDTAKVAAQRLGEKQSVGTGARIDAVRAATNVEIAESDFDRKEREYQEEQVRVSKLSLRSDILDLKAEIKELEAENIDLDIAKSQLHGIGMEYQRRTSVENPTGEQQQDIDTLTVLFEDTKVKIERLETRMNLRAQDILVREEQLTDDELVEIEKDIASEEDEYLQYAKAARKTREKASDSILDAREQEAKLVEQLDEDGTDSVGFLNKHSDSNLIKTLNKAQRVKKEILKAGLEIFEQRIEDAEENIEAGELKGRDTLIHEQTLEELTEAKSMVAATKAVALVAEKKADISALRAEGVKKSGERSGFFQDISAEMSGASTDIAADIARALPYVGEFVHIGLHIAAGIERAAGHTLAGLERVAGETHRGETLINAEGKAAETRMNADATQLGLTDTEGLNLAAGMRHGEVERTISFDRVGQIMTETGERVMQDIFDALEKAGLDIETLEGLVGDEGLGNIFLEGMDNKQIFEGFGEHGEGVRAALGDFMGGEDLQNPMDVLGKGTVYRAATEGFIGGLFTKLSSSGLVPSGSTEHFLTVLKGSKNAVKVQSDYSVISHEERLEGDFRGRAEVSKQFGYAHWFDQTGDREAAQRLATQASPAITKTLLGFNENKSEDAYGNELDSDELSHTGNRGYEENYEDGDEESSTSMVGSGVSPEVSEGWLRTPYGSLIRRKQDTSTTPQQKGIAGVIQKLTEKKSTKANKKVDKKGKRRRKVRIGLVIIAVILVITLTVNLTLVPFFFGSLGHVAVSNHQRNQTAGQGCTCGCLEQYYAGGGVAGEGAAYLGDGMISGTLEGGGIVTFNVPSVVTQTRNELHKQIFPQKNWGVYEYDGIKLDIRPPYDSDGLPYVIVAEKLLIPTTPDTSRVETTAVHGSTIYARLLVREETGDLFAVIARVNTNDGKAHTFNKYPGESTRYGSLLPYQNVTTSGGQDLRPYVNDQVSYNIPSGLIQTGIAYPNSANAGGHIPSDGPWMPAHADSSTIEFNQKSALMDFRAAHPNSTLLQVQTSTDRALLESLALVAPFDSTVDSPDFLGSTLPTDTEATEDTEDTEATEDTANPTDSVDSPVESPPISSRITHEIVCDCPLDCYCYEIHGFENIIRSDGTPVGGHIVAELPFVSGLPQISCPYVIGILNQLRTEGVSEARLKILTIGLSLTDNVPRANARDDLVACPSGDGSHQHSALAYFWGGKSPKGWDESWGTEKEITIAGSGVQAEGSYWKFGLDCSGYTMWVYETYSDGAIILPSSTAAWETNLSTYQVIDEADIKPGDVALWEGHIGIYMYTKSDGTKMYLQALSTNSGVVLAPHSGTPTLINVLGE